MIKNGGNRWHFHAFSSLFKGFFFEKSLLGTEEAGKLVVTATEMLASMEAQRVPGPAEEPIGLAPYRRI